jgi:hypothetical protein
MKQRLVNFLGRDAVKLYVRVDKEKLAELMKFVESARTREEVSLYLDQIFYMLACFTSHPDRLRSYCDRVRDTNVTTIAKLIEKHLIVKSSAKSKHDYLSRSLRLISSIKKFATKHSLNKALETIGNKEFQTSLNLLLADPQLVSKYSVPFFISCLQCLEQIVEDEALTDSVTAGSLGFFLDLKGVYAVLKEIFDGSENFTNIAS